MKTVYWVIIIAGLALFGLYANGFLNRFIPMRNSATTTFAQFTLWSVNAWKHDCPTASFTSFNRITTKEMVE
jgi:hypothetical protein